jgi:hypothetical protein
MKKGIRRSDRVYVRITVTLNGKDSKGNPFEEKSTIIALSRHGACIETNLPLHEGSILTIDTPQGMRFEASIIWVGNEAAKTAGQVGIECTGLADALGFHFPPMEG